MDNSLSTSSGFSDLVDGKVSHDKITKFLSGEAMDRIVLSAAMQP